jgi:integrase
LRRGALLGLRWEHVHWQRSEIRLPAELDKCGQERLKPINRLVLRHLLRIRTPRARVFAWNRSQGTWYKQWRRIQEAAGLPRDEWIGLHDLKRACGTRLATVASLWVVQRRLDHSSLSTSQHYINATREEREAIERMPLPSVLREPSEDCGVG